MFPGSSTAILLATSSASNKGQSQCKQRNGERVQEEFEFPAAKIIKAPQIHLR